MDTPLPPPPPPLSARFRGHRGPVISIALPPAPSPTSRPTFFASGSEDGSLRTWDMETTRAVRGFNFQAANSTPVAGSSSSPKPEAAPITSVCFGDSGNSLYCSRGNLVHFFDLRSQTAMIVADHGQTFGTAADEINQITINDKATFLATCDDSGAVQVLDMRANYQPFKKFRSRHSNICSSVTFRPTSPWDLWSGSLDYTVRHWDFSRGSVIDDFDLSKPVDRPTTTSSEDKKHPVGNPSFVNSLSFDTTGSKLACAKGDGEIELVERSSGQWKRTRVCPMALLDGKKMELGHRWSVTRVAFVPSSSSGNTDLVSGGLDGRVILWKVPEAETETPVVRYTIEAERKVDSLAVFPRGSGQQQDAANVPDIGILVGGVIASGKETKEEKNGDILLFAGSGASSAA